MRIFTAIVVVVVGIVTYSRTHRVAWPIGAGGGAVISFYIDRIRANAAARAEMLNEQFLRYIYADEKEREGFPKDWMDEV